MKKLILGHMLVAAALALAACDQAVEETTTAAPAPADVLTEAQAMGPEQLLVHGFQKLVAYQQAHPEVQPTCSSIRGTESRGVIPAEGVPDTSVYKPLAGSLVVSVQCGPQLTQTRMDPREHWLVVFTPGAADVSVVNCAGPDGRDVCPRAVIPPAPPAGAKQ